MAHQILKRGRKVSFLDSSLKIDGIISVLQPLIYARDIITTRLWIDSNIKHKQSYYKYLNFCIEKQFVVRTPHITKFGKEKKGMPVYHSITDKGRLFLEIIQ